MLNNLRIGSKLVLAFLVVAAIAALVGMVGITKVHHLNRNDEITSTKMIYPMGVLSKLSSRFQQAKGMLVEIMYANDPAKRQALFQEFDKLREEVNSLKSAYAKTLLTEKERQLAGEFVEAQKFTDQSIKRMMELSQGGRKDDAIAVLDGDVKQGALRMQQAMDKLVAGKEAQLQEALESNRHEASAALIQMVILVGVAILVSIGFGIFIAGSITKPLAQAVRVAHRVAEGDLSVTVSGAGADEIGQLLRAIAEMVEHLRQKVARTVEISTGIAAASTQLHSTAAQIATGTEAVAAQAGTVATASEEMSSTSADISRNCTMAADASRQSAAAATEGSAVVQETITGMTVIAERVRQTSRTIEALGSRSEQIGDIIGTIEDIADQTNLLALNAAIEAARAGEQGRGFAVVADEVRALAERTTKATREIGEMIKAIQSDTVAAVKAMEEGVGEVEKGAVSSQRSGQALENILNRIDQVSMQINQIATAAEEQTATTNEVTRNVQQINEVVSSSARGAEETAAAALQLDRRARELDQLMSDFRLA